MRPTLPTARLLAASALVATTPAAAESIIKNPGEHPDYAVELDPHLVLQHGYTPAWLDTGVGLGLRASIPFLDGPIDSINNSMAISFGVDWAHFGDEHCADYYFRVDPRLREPWWDHRCRGDDLVFPVALQWNFWLTDVVSVFGEPGLAVAYERWEAWCGWDTCYEDHARVLPFVGWAGGRFLFSDRIGMTVRLGYPSITVGATFLL